MNLAAVITVIVIGLICLGVVLAQIPEWKREIQDKEARDERAKAIDTDFVKFYELIERNKEATKRWEKTLNNVFPIKQERQ